MSSSSVLKTCVGACAVALFLSMAGDAVFAEKTPRDLNATTWTTAGMLKFSGSDVQNESAEAEGLFAFGALPVPSIVGDFTMVLTYTSAGGPAELLVKGQYALVKPGKPEFLVDRRALQEQFEGDSYITDVDLKGTLKTVKDVETLQVDLKVKYEECAFDTKGKVRCQKTTLSYKGEGGIAPPS